jgi:GNAT superfamily N-acetyltransferase
MKSIPVPEVSRREITQEPMIDLGGTAPLIRRALLSDVPNLAPMVELYWQFEQIAGFDRARVEALLAELFSKSERGTCWVAEHGGVLRGYLLVTFVFSLEHGGLMAEIDEFFVHPEQRSSGVGAALLTEAERALSNSNLVRLQLQLGAENARARRFYERHGFGQREGYQLWDKAL